MQEIITHFATTAKAFGLQVNIKKKEISIMFQPFQVMMITTDAYKSKVMI